MTATGSIMNTDFALLFVISKNFVVRQRIINGHYYFK